MRAKSTAVILCSCLLSLVSTSSLACGESLFRVGKGVAFRQFTAPLPGNIVVVARTDADLALVEQLVAAGHDIHVVSNPAEIRHAVERHDADIVLALFSQRDEVLAQTADTSVDFLPVARDGSDEVRLARRLHDKSLTSDDDLLRYLKVIHRTLKARG